MAVERRGRSIRITFQIDKKRQRITWPEPYSPQAIANAERVQGRIRRDIADGVFTDLADYIPQFEAANRKTFGEFAQDWLDRECKAGSDIRQEYVYTLNRVWLPLLAHRELRGLTPSDIQDAIHEGLSGVEKPGSRNVYKVPLRQILRSAWKLELTQKDLTAWVETEKRQKPQPDPFSIDEAKRIIESFDGGYRNYFRFAFWSGLRVGESLALLWEDVDLDEGTVYVHRSHTFGTTKEQTKTGEARTVYLNSESLKALKDQRAESRLAGELVFSGRSPYAIDRLRAEFNKKMDSLGIRRRTLRSTRHTYATVMLNQSVDLNFIAKQLGHSVDVLLKHYAKWINDEDRVQREMAKLEEVL